MEGDIRREYILNLFQHIRPVVNKFLFELWESVYTDSSIPQRYWLEKFQLSLKSTLQIDSSLIKVALKHYEEDLASILHKTYVLTGESYYDEAPQVKESVELLLNFIKEVLVNTAREIWYVPYYFYFMTHDKIKAPEGRHELDKIIKNSIKITLKKQVGEMIVAQRAVVEKYKEHIEGVKVEEEGEEDDLGSNDDAEIDSDASGTSEDISDESSSEIASEVTIDKASEHHTEDFASHSRPHSPSHSRSNSPPRSPKYVVGSDLKLDLIPQTKPPSIASSASSMVSLKALPTDGDDIQDIYIPRKSNPTSLDIPLVKKKTAREHLYNNMTWYRANPKLYQHLLAKKKKKRN